MDSLGGDSLGSASGAIRLDASQALGSLNAVGAGLRNLDRQSHNQGTGLLAWAGRNEQALNTVGTGLLGVGAAFLGSFGLATKTAMDFDAQISAVGSVAGASKDQLSALREEALRLGADTTFSASEAAAGMEIMLKAGASLESVLNGGTEAVLNLSAATGVDVPLAAETAATAMNVFGVSAEEAANIIAQSANASSLDVNDWALALKSVGPVAASLGLDMEDLSQAMVLLGDAGIKGEVAGTALRNILMGLADPAGEAALGLAELGIATHDAQGNFRGLEAITHDLAGSWGTMNAAQKLQIATMIAGEQGAASFMAIMDAQTEAVNENGDAFQDASKRMKATGTVATQAAARMDNLKGSWEQLKGTVETVAITFTSGLAPAMRWVVDGANKLLQGVLALPEPLKTVLAATVGITGALAVFTGGSMLAAVKVAELVTAASKLGLGFTSLLAPVRLLGAALMAIWANPILLAGALAIGAAIVAYKTNFMGFGDMVRDALGWVQDLWTALKLVFGTPSEKTVNVTAAFDGNAYTITETTLPNGTKRWDIIEDETGGTFGTILQSYTDETGETYIQIKPKDGGPAFWAKANLESGKPTAMNIPITADPEKFYRVRNQLMATGETKLIVVNADGEPAGDVIRTLIDNPLTGQKKVILQLGNGQQFIATVDSTTGQIINSREITITADTEPLSEVEKLSGRINEMVKNIEGAWMAVNWAIEGTKLLIQDVIDQANGLIEVLNRIPGVDITPLPGGRGEESSERGRNVSVDDTGQGVYEDEARPGVTVRPRPAVNRPVNEGALNVGQLAGLITSIEWIKKNTRPAVDEVGFLGGAIGALGPIAGLTSVDMNKMATSAQTTDVAVFGAGQSISTTGTGIGATFGAIAASVLAGSSQAATAAITNFAALQSGVTSQSSTANANASGAFGSLAASVGGAVAGLQSGVSSRMASLQAAVTSQASSANQNATGQFSSMSATSKGHFMGMQTAAALQMALMASTATTQGDATMSNMVGALAGGMARVAWTAMGFVTAISSAGGSAADAAYSAGANVSQGFANGMLAYLGVIQGAAAAMVAAAAAAVTAKAMISSPSRLFRGFGAFVGEGFELGIRSSIPDVTRASAALVGAGVPSPTVLSTMYGGYGGGGTQYIDRSTHVTNNVALSESDLLRLTQSADLARAVARHMSDPDASAQFGGA